MSEFFESITARQNSPESVAHRAALFLSVDHHRAILAEAGDDVYFYAAMFKRCLPHRRGIEFFAAQGRPRVIAALEILNLIGKGDRSFAIVDRDFNLDDPALTADGRRLTIEFYSIESYFADRDVLLDYGQSQLGLEAASNERQRWVDAVDVFLGNVSDMMTEQHIVALWCRDRGKSCNLNNFNPGNYAVIDEFGNVSVPAEFEAAFQAHTGPDCELATEAELEDCRGRLAARRWQVWFRGHYFFALFVKFLNVFRRKLDEENRAAGRSRTRTRTEITERHAFEAGTNFVPIPQIIEEFFLAVAS